MTSMRLPICAMMPSLEFCIGSKIWRSERESHLGEASEKQGEYWKLYNKHNRTLCEASSFEGSRCCRGF